VQCPNGGTCSNSACETPTPTTTSPVEETPTAVSTDTDTNTPVPTTGTLCTGKTAFSCYENQALTCNQEDNSQCYCFSNTSGGASCYANAFCDHVDSCQVDSDCQPGWGCAIKTCCVVPKCFQIDVCANPATAPSTIFKKRAQNIAWHAGTGITPGYYQ